MKPLSRTLFTTILVLTLLPLLIEVGPVHGAGITGSYPGSPGVWNGLTTNTFMVIYLDSPVAMIGIQPDMTYCVKKLSGFSGFDYVFTDVACDAAASDDRMSVNLYPQALLDPDAPYAYHVVNLNFEGGGSAQNFSQCYFTGTNPVIPPAYTVNEANQCTDYNNPDFNGVSGGNYCFRCHIGGYTKVGAWDFTNYPVPSCIP